MDDLANQYLELFAANVWTPGSAPWAARNAPGVTLQKSTAGFYRGGASIGSGNAVMTPQAGSGSFAVPFYTALVVTTRTAAAGRSGRGRMYLPFTSANLNNNTGQVTSTTQQDLLDNLKDLVVAMRTLSGVLPGVDGYTPVVVSLKHSTFNQITTLTCDSVPDTQHGRTRKDIPVLTASIDLLS
jgi:hypothetical protein